MSNEILGNAFIPNQDQNLFVGGEFTVSFWPSASGDSESRVGAKMDIMEANSILNSGTAHIHLAQLLLGRRLYSESKKYFGEGLVNLGIMSTEGPANMSGWTFNASLRFGWMIPLGKDKSNNLVLGAVMNGGILQTSDPSSHLHYGPSFGAIIGFNFE